MALRINVRKLKALAWFVSVLALAAAGYTFYDIVQGKKTGRYTARPPDDFHQILMSDLSEDPSFSRDQGYYEPGQYEKTWRARLDGSKKEVAAPPGPGGEDDVVKQPEAPAIDTVLEVSLIVWSDDPQRRFVALEYKQSQGGATTGDKARRLHLTEGESLMPPYDESPYFASVKSIDQQTVTFDYGGEELTVSPGLGREGNDVPLDQFAIAGIDDPSAGYDGPPDDSVKLDDTRWIIGVKDQQALRDRSNEILDKDLSVRTVTPSGGGRSYLELSNVAPGSLPAKFGFQSGDRIISVNGIPMPSVAAAINWAKANSELPVYKVVYESKGAVQEKVVYWK